MKIAVTYNVRVRGGESEAEFDVNRRELFEGYVSYKL